eukprot:4528947-Pleurochrysis_carterae.AAC.2
MVDVFAETVALSKGASASKSKGGRVEQCNEQNIALIGAGLLPSSVAVTAGGSRGDACIGLI